MGKEEIRDKTDASLGFEKYKLIHIYPRVTYRPDKTHIKEKKCLTTNGV